MQASQADISRWIPAIMHEAIGGFIGTTEKKQVCLVVSEDRSLWSRYVHGGFSTGGQKLTGWLRSCGDHGLDVVVHLTGTACQIVVSRPDVGRDHPEYVEPCIAALDLAGVDPTNDNKAVREIVFSSIELTGGFPPEPGS